MSILFRAGHVTLQTFADDPTRLTSARRPLSPRHEGSSPGKEKVGRKRCQEPFYWGRKRCQEPFYWEGKGVRNLFIDNWQRNCYFGYMGRPKRTAEGWTNLPCLEPRQRQNDHFWETRRLRGVRASGWRSQRADGNADCRLLSHAKSLALCPLAVERWRPVRIYRLDDAHAYATMALAQTFNGIGTRLSGAF